MSHKLVRCSNCDLVYVPAPPRQEELAQAYHVAEYDSAQEAQDASTAYALAIAPVLSKLVSCDSALEIGTGTGIFLQHLKDSGFKQLVGIEPSKAAIAAADPSRRSWIQEGIFQESEHAANSFDLICCFMTMEHVANPAAIAQSAFNLLKPGGAFVIVTHDWRSWINRILGKRSPIIDVEHMQLFSHKNLQLLFANTGYQQVSLRAFANRYTLKYWLRLFPFPNSIKRALSRLLAVIGLEEMKISLNVGNVISSGFKPL